jgi:cysteine-S-conjugate beta-lyase
LGRGPVHAEGDRRGVSADADDTKLVGGGRRPEWRGRLVNPPVHRGSTILYDSVEEIEAASPGHGQHYYGLHGGPNQWSLCEALTELEPGAGGTMLLPTGLAAVTAALLTVLKSGDELLMVDSAYRPTRRFCDTILKRLGIATRYYDPLIGTGIADLIGERTRALFLESPGSLTFEVQDVPGMCAVAKERGLVTLLDNTWATPLFFPALEKGVDLSILALSKYVGGHSDLLLGSVTSTPEWFGRLERTVFDLGQYASPDDTWLAARGLRTMGVRLRRHEESGLRVARWLAEQPQVARVLHPALPECPGHEYWRRDFKGATGLFAFVFRGGDEAARTRFIEGLRHFGLGYSWGGYESLAVPADPNRVRTATQPLWEGPLVRLSIGLEGPDDLIADLAAGLARYGSG